MNIQGISSDYVDENNYRHIDIWETDDENEEGKSVALFCEDTGKHVFLLKEFSDSTVVNSTLDALKIDWDNIQKIVDT